MKKLIIIVTLFFSFFSVCFAQSGIRKQNLSVLYVGNSPDMKRISKGMADINGPFQYQDHQTRMPGFVDFLSQYFTKVKGVDASLYTQKMSDDYDVTIFDCLPAQIKPKVGYEAAHYLTEDYDRPTIFIAHNSDYMGRSLGLKLDWCCLCLDNYALNTNWDSQIFKGPFKTNYQMEDRPTPDGVAYDFKSQGKEVPETLPMWKVQIPSLEDQNYYVGMVSFSRGFTDSPDAEFISGGECLKDYGAVAIGRHGNFLHWGFAASPDHMTEQGKVTFANAVVYISKFAGQKPVARKWDNRTLYRTQAERQSHPYDYAEEWEFITDKDAESLQIPNWDKAILDKAISLMETGKDVEKGLRILKRYTFKDFSTAKEWRKWYNKNQSKLFFTDAGGYKFLVNVQEDQYPMTDDRRLDVKIDQKEQGEDPNRAPVIAEMNVWVYEDMEYAVLSLDVKKGHHLYAQVPPSVPMKLTKVEFILPEGVEKKGEVSYPNSTMYDSKGEVLVYEGSLMFFQYFTGDVAGKPIKCKVSYQCCTNEMCYPPEEIELTSYAEEDKQGQIFTDFTVPNGNVDGTPVSLSDYVGKGKYVLVDFWASWCAPCRAGIPHLKDIYKNYAGDKFDIVSVAVWDKRKDSMKALEEEKMPWNQIIDAQNIPGSIYAFGSIPTMMFFGPDGTIISQELTGDGLEELLDSLLK